MSCSVPRKSIGSDVSHGFLMKGSLDDGILEAVPDYLIRSETKFSVKPGLLFFFLSFHLFFICLSVPKLEQDNQTRKLEIESITYSCS